jgi:hypothetical protein
MRRALATTFLLFALAAPSRAAVPIRMVMPSPGADLAAGSLAILEWEAEEDTFGGRRIEEWEAFLSLDGGRTWPLRLTPHLDAGIRRFSFRVPDFPSREARLLLRFGNEQVEVETEIPGSFTISAGLEPPVLDPLPPSLRLSRGESARPGDGGVVLWTEGTRDGAGLREVSAQETSQEWEEVQAARSLLLPLFWPAPGRADLPPPDGADLDRPAPTGTRASAETAAPRPAAATRVLIHRYNE